ncbi:BREX-1 system adenine-specific DNA-methyltransferase PglX [Marinilactibacillus psychrotolerans]|uniref:BREX-1 system adenine-specific DNA-methyltransferase PglX n=1 Tax=Marinilactibacillus psychrotolerans TaxID=191770 RepID=UPI003883B720
MINFALQELKLIDPSMGSGHILVYAFDVLMQLYEAEGESPRSAAELIIEKNLFGLDIDKRAFQLTYFALMMKGRQYSRRILSKNIKPNVYAVPDNLGIGEAELQLLPMKFNDQKKAHKDLAMIIDGFKNGNDLGSLIEFEDVDFDNLKSGLDDNDVSFVDHTVSKMVHIGELLQQKYDIGITNPPYMGRSGMNKELSDYVKKVYPDSKSDLFGVFIERVGRMVKSTGYYAMITQHAWMFLSSFEKLRVKVNSQTIINMAHLGTRAFEEISGEVVQTTTFVMSPIQHKNYVGTYLRMVDFANHKLKEKKLLDAIKTDSHDYIYHIVQDNFAKIPGQPISYWVNKNLIHDFVVGTRMDEILQPKVGLQTGRNDKFIRLWWEVDQTKVKYDATSISDSVQSRKKWFPYNKGGSFRRWYGNYDYLVNWEDNGNEIRNFVDDKGKLRSRPQNTDYYFKEAITWSDITSSKFSLRYREYGSIHDVKGMEAFELSGEHLFYILGVLNTHIGNYIFKLLNPTISLQIGNFQSFPLLIEKKEETEEIARQNVALSKSDWDTSETSWNFTKSPLI